MMKLYNVYTSSFYGSNLYNLFDKSCTRLYSAWNCAVRQAFHVNNRTHRYLIKTISQSLHPMVFLSSRFIKFAQSMELSKKPSVRLLSNLFKHDKRTTFGQNWSAISKHCLVPVQELTPHVVKANMNYFPIPEQEKWRESLVLELLLLNNNDFELSGFEKNEIADILKDVCTL